MKPISRRLFLSDVGLGCAGMALGTLLHRDGAARDGGGAPDGRPHFVPKAKSVIWIVLGGGFSHLETFDPKPALNAYAGKTYNDTPYANPIQSPLHDKRSRNVVSADVEKMRPVWPTIYPLQVGFRKHGRSGIEVCDWLPHLATCVDEIALVRSMYTTDNDHYALNQFHTGRHRLDGDQPCLGAWVSYGLGTMNENLPQYVVLGGEGQTHGRPAVSADYLGPRYSGVPLSLDPRNPLPYGSKGPGVLEAEQRNEYELIGTLNGLRGVEYPGDPAVRARIRSYELAFGMQAAGPEAVAVHSEPEEVRKLYGLDGDVTRAAGQRLLAARRLAERGVRFVQVYTNGYNAWDSHQNLRENHAKLCASIDKPVAGLLTDLKRRGLGEEVVVVFCTEFGRTPGMEQRNGAKDGRDHHPHGFSVWLAGAGIKAGTVYGATDELGFHGEPGRYVTDIHATVLKLLGLEGRRLDVPGRKRIELDYGRPIEEILA
jgi:hypothetical protein